MRPKFSVLAERLITGVIVMCSVATAAVVLRDSSGRRQGTGPSASMQFIQQPNWRKYTSEGHWIGSESARAVLVEFADFQCPACRELDRRLRTLLGKYSGDFAVIYRHLPIPSHPFAKEAAVASECAAEQGRFTAMHHLLFDKQDSIGMLDWRGFAAQAGITRMDDFGRCLKDSVVIARVDKDRNIALDMGARGTPTVLMNGVRINGAAFTTVIDSLIQSSLAASNGRAASRRSPRERGIDASPPSASAVSHRADGASLVANRSLRR